MSYLAPFCTSGFTAIHHTPGGGRGSGLGMPAQLEHMDSAFGGLRPVAMDIFHLLGYVSLNMAGFRKMLKKYAKNVEPSKPQPGEAASSHLSRLARTSVKLVQMRAWLADGSCLADGTILDLSALLGMM